MNSKDIVWYNLDYDGVDPIFSCSDFQNVPLIGAKGGLINYSNVLSLRQMGYLLKDKPEDQLFEEFLIAEWVDDSEMLKRIHCVWGKIYRIGKKKLDKQNCIALKPYTYWVRSSVKTIKLSYPWEPSTSLKPTRPPVVSIFEVDKPKYPIKLLEKEKNDF